jgi:hypothetical protein
VARDRCARPPRRQLIVFVHAASITRLRAVGTAARERAGGNKNSLIPA